MKNLTAYCLMIPVLLLTAGSLCAQEIQYGVEPVDIFTDFGEISEEEFSLEADHDYPYEFIRKESAVEIREGRGGIEAIIDHHIRIKVHSDDPMEMAEASLVGIPYYFANDMEVISELEGLTHHPDGTVVELDDADVARSDINTRYRIIEFEFPDVKQGSVLEYKYRVTRRFIEELPDFYFSEPVPTREAIFTLQNEQFLRYNVVPQNVNFDIEYSEQRIDTSSVPRIFTFERPEPVLIETWEAKDIPAVEEEPYISSINDLRGKLKFQISSFGIPRQPLENSWEFVAAQIHRNMDPIGAVQRQGQIAELGQEIGSGFNDRVAAQDSIYTHLNRLKTFNGLPSVFAEGDLGAVLEGEPADQAQINMTLVSMLRGAGIDAYPLYISGRDFGMINPDFPSMYQFNRMLVWSEIDGKEYFMDASYPNSFPNLIPVNAFTNKGFVLLDRGYQWVEMRPERSRFALDVSVDAELTSAGGLNGTMSARAGGYTKQQILEDLDDGENPVDVVRESFFEIYPEIEIRSVEIFRDEDRDGSIEINTEFSIEQFGISYREGFEIRPMLVGYLFDNPFEATERRSPVMMDAPEEVRVDYTISMPAGFSVETGGETRRTGIDGAELEETYESTGGKLRYSLDVNISRREFSVDEYSGLRDIYSRWVEISNDVWYLEGQ